MRTLILKPRLPRGFFFLIPEVSTDQVPAILPGRSYSGVPRTLLNKAGEAPICHSPSGCLANAGRLNTLARRTARDLALVLLGPILLILIAEVVAYFFMQRAP
jgi:hypothetical protein